MKTAKVFRHGNGQAVRLPKEFRFQSDEVLVKRAAGGGVLLLPKRITLDQLDSILGAFQGRFVRRQPRMRRNDAGHDLAARHRHARLPDQPRAGIGAHQVQALRAIARRGATVARFLLEQSEAEKIVNDMKRQVEATWYETVRASGVSEQDAETIRGAFVYPGFSL